MAPTLTFNDIFQDMNFATPSYSVGDVIASLFITLALAVFIFYVYKMTFSGVVYSKNYNLTLILVAMIVSVLMRSVSGSLALSLGMVGALSIIRFRTAIKDPKDVAFLFWAVALGITTGVELYSLSITSTIFIGLFLVIASKYFVYRKQHLLVVSGKDVDTKELKKLLKTYCKRFSTRSIAHKNECMEVSIELDMTQERQSSLVKKLSAMKSVDDVMLFAHDGQLIN